MYLNRKVSVIQMFLWQECETLECDSALGSCWVVAPFPLLACTLQPETLALSPSGKSGVVLPPQFLKKVSAALKQSREGVTGNLSTDSRGFYLLSDRFGALFSVVLVPNSVLSLINIKWNVLGGVGVHFSVLFRLGTVWSATHIRRMYSP